MMHAIFRRISQTPSGLSASMISRRFSNASGSLVRSELVPADDGGASDVYTVTMSKAPVNSLDLAMVKALHNELLELEDKGATGILLKSDAKVFSAGIDLGEFYKAKKPQLLSFWGEFEALWHTLYMSPMATVAALESHAIAGGCILAMACDYRVMAKNEKLKIGLNESVLGMVPPRWLQAMTKETVGTRNAEILLQTGSLVNPQTALDFGLVDELVETDQVQSRAAELLGTYTCVPRNARADTKAQSRGHVAALAGPGSCRELWNCLKGKEADDSLTKVVEGLNAKKKN